MAAQVQAARDPARNATAVGDRADIPRALPVLAGTTPVDTRAAAAALDAAADAGRAAAVSRKVL